MVADAEFDVQAAAIAVSVRELSRDGAIAPHEMFAAGSRGSGNPAALAWLAENLALQSDLKVVDLGSGLGGPSSWIVARYGCVVVALEPALSAAAGSRALFPLSVVNASSTAVPFRTDAFDAALLLGVISVVADGEGVLREARRVARALGLLDYCATRSRDVYAGGSRFRTQSNLERLVAASGWQIQQVSAMPVEAPKSWTDAAARVEVRPEPNEEEVAAVIEAGSIAPFMLVASR